jgi:hypothetical protein
MVILLPGTTGSVLQKDGRDIVQLLSCVAHHTPPVLIARVSHPSDPLARLLHSQRRV